MTRPGDPFRFVTSDGLTLRGRRWGNGATQIVFTAGTGLPVETYQAAFTPLFQAATILALNARGHGGSDVPEKLENWDGLLNELREFIAREMRPPVIVCGHSRGALSCLQLAAESAQLVSGLLLLDPTIRLRRGDPQTEIPLPEEQELSDRTLRRRSTWTNRDEAGADLRDKGVYRPWEPEAFAAFLAAGLKDSPEGGVELSCPPWLESQIFSQRPRSVVWEWADQVRAPTVILRGETSDLALAPAMEDLADAIPIATVISVKGSHTFPQEQSRATGEALTFALSLLTRAGAAAEGAS